MEKSVLLDVGESARRSCGALDCTETLVAISNEFLMAEVDDILRNMPPQETLRHSTEQNHSWLGRVSALISAWNMPETITLKLALSQFQGQSARDAQEGLRKLITLLHFARHDLRMKTAGPLSAAVGAGNVFDYFDELRKAIEPATQDILFVDPYLDAEFVSRYLPHVRKGAAVRLLARERLSTLLPAVEAFSRQSGLTVGVRSVAGFHDRYLFVDGAACFQSGASFKDGAKNSPTTLTQITDAFQAVKQTYENLWASAKAER